MDLLGALQWVQAVLFAGLGLAALVSYARRRTRPTAYAAAAFGTLAIVTLHGRVTATLGLDSPELVRDLTTGIIVAFPWFLAAFVWSLEGPLPRWLRMAGVGTGLVAASLLVLPPLGDAADRPAAIQAFVVGVALLWIGLVGAAAVHLWRVGRAQHVVRARTRLLASGGVSLSGALLLAAVLPSGARGIATVTLLLSAVAAVLFAAGVAPPPVLRWYWRQQQSQQMHRMQTALVAAVTPEEVAAAVTPVVADTFGAGALCADPAGRLVTSHGIGRRDADALADQLVVGRARDTDVQVLEVDGWQLAVHTSPYAPLFGEDERDLLARFGLQFRLALQRAELFIAHRRDRDELERSSRDMQAMLVGLSHDLRSPAVTISTYAALLRDARDDDDREQMVEGIRDSSAYLDRLVDGLLELSRIGRNDGEPEPVALGDVVDGVSRRLVATHPGVRVEVSTALPTIRVDRLRIEQVVDNLLGNAAKHGGREDLTITIAWHPAATADDGVLVICDDGRGVPEAEREHVFTLFRRGSGASVAGSGVGLGLVRRIVESYGGTIRFAPSDQGARVEMTVPASLLCADAGAPTGTRTGTSRQVTRR